MSETIARTDDSVRMLAGLTDKPSLVGLSYALRHKETWPEGFVWDYDDCYTHALGLAWKLWESISIPSCWHVAKFMSIPHEVSRGFFLAAHLFAQVRFHDITPEHVADAIDAYLATAE